MSPRQIKKKHALLKRATTVKWSSEHVLAFHILLTKYKLLSVINLVTLHLAAYNKMQFPYYKELQTHDWATHWALITDTNFHVLLTCRNRQINLMPGTPSCWEDSWRVAMTTKCDWWHILLVVCSDGKVVGTQALSDCGRANDWWLHWVNSFQLHANFKSMNSRLEMLLSLNAREIKWIKKQIYNQYSMN